MAKVYSWDKTAYFLRNGAEAQAVVLEILIQIPTQWYGSVNNKALTYRIQEECLVIITEYMALYKSSECYMHFEVTNSDWKQTVSQQFSVSETALLRQPEEHYDSCRLWLNQVQVVKIICHFQCFSSYMGPSTTASPSFASLCSLQL